MLLESQGFGFPQPNHNTTHSRVNKAAKLSTASAPVISETSNNIVRMSQHRSRAVTEKGREKRERQSLKEVEEDAVYKLLCTLIPDRWPLGTDAISLGGVYYMLKKSDTHTQLIEYLARIPSVNTGSQFLDKFPSEIRNEVY